jgi:hypothetical protein
MLWDQLADPGRLLGFCSALLAHLQLPEGAHVEGFDTNSTSLRNQMLAIWRDNDGGNGLDELPQAPDLKIECIQGDSNL